MSKIVFCVDSFYQLLIAINLRINKYQADSVDVILINSMQNAELVYANLKKGDIFENAYLINSNLNINKLNTTFFQRIPKYYDYLYSMVCAENYAKEKLSIYKIPYYDIFIFNGYKPLVQCLFNAFCKKNQNIKCYRIDDGTASYIQEWCNKKTILRKFIEKVMRLCFNFKNIEEYIAGFYVPDVNLINYSLSYDLLKLPDYSNKNLINVLNSIFEFDLNQTYENKRIIYFGGYGNSQLEQDFFFLKEILKIIPKEMILVKPHPRVEKGIYDSLGIDVVKQPTIPWELYMINCNFNNAIFISIMSSAVLSSRIIFHRNGKDIYLYNSTRKNGCNNEINSKFTGFLKEYKRKMNHSSQILLPSSMKSLRELLIKLDLTDSTD